MLNFIVAVFFLLITPGPGVLTTAGIGSGFGWRAGLIFLAGLFVGTNLVALVVVTGLWSVLLLVPGLRWVLALAALAWFVWLAGKIAFAGARIGFIEAERAPGFWNGVGLQFINPKAYTVNTLLFFDYPFWPDQFVTEAAVKFLIINAIWIPVHLIWLKAGVTVRRMDLAPGTQRMINYAMAAALIVVVVLALFSG